VGMEMEGMVVVVEVVGKISIIIIEGMMIINISY
jgi:hypothetical protein